LRKTPRAFALDQRAERLANQGGLFGEPRERLRLGDKFIIQSKGCSHGRSQASKLASLDAKFQRR
jgi:hypothetical protein